MIKQSTVHMIVTLVLTYFVFSTLTYSERKSKRANTSNVYDFEIVTIPENISSSFGTLKKQVVLCHPKNQKGEKSPLVISLHGAGGGSAPIESRMRSQVIKELSQTENLQYEAKILVPQSDRVWEPESLSKMLDYILSQNSDIDINRIYCIGYSMGGKGTWEWSMLEPERFAAISPKGFIPDYSKIKSMTKLPIWAMVGTKDTKERVQGISIMEEEFNKVGSSNVKVSLFEGANHKTATTKIKELKDRYTWLFSQSN